MRGEFHLEISNTFSDLLLVLGEDRFFVPKVFLLKVDVFEPIPVYHWVGGCSIGSIVFHNDKWRVVTNRYQGEITKGDLENVIHCRQKKGQIEYSYLIPRSQQVLGVA